MKMQLIVAICFLVGKCCQSILLSTSRIKKRRIGSVWSSRADPNSSRSESCPCLNSEGTHNLKKRRRLMSSTFQSSHLLHGPWFGLPSLPYAIPSQCSSQSPNLAFENGMNGMCLAGAKYQDGNFWRDSRRCWLQERAEPAACGCSFP